MIKSTSIKVTKNPRRRIQLELKTNDEESKQTINRITEQTSQASNSMNRGSPSKRSSVHNLQLIDDTQSSNLRDKI